MEFNYSIDRTEVFASDLDNRLYIVGWCLGGEGEIPEIALYVNSTLVRYTMKRMTRFDAYRAMEGLRRNENKKPYPGEVREKMIDEAGFLIGLKNYPKTITDVRLFAKFKEGTEEILHLKERQIRKKVHTGNLMYNIEGVGFNKKKNILAIIGWYDNLTKEPVNVSVTDADGKTVEGELQQDSHPDDLTDVFAAAGEKMTRFSVALEGSRDDQFVLHLNDVEYPFKAPEEENARTAVVKRFFANLTPRNISKFFEVWHAGGFAIAVDKMNHLLNPSTFYDSWFRNQRVTPEELDEQRKTKLPYEPKISLLVPTYNTPVKLLKQMIETVEQQSYANWQLCIADGSDEKNPARAMIRKYAAKDKRIKVTYLDQNYGISGNTNKALELADGDYIAMYDHDDFLELNCLFEVAKAINEQKCDILYTDEDKYADESEHFDDPNLKPDFSIDLLRSHNYITHLFVVKSEIIKGIGGFRSAFDGSQDYDLILRCIEKTDKIYHLPKILYHWRIHEGSMAEDPESKMYCYEAGKKAIEENLERSGLKGTVEMLPKPYYGLYHTRYTVQGNPLVSVLIPNYENRDVLKRCVDSLFNINSYKNIEVIIIENNSKSKEIFDYYEQVQKEHDNVHVVTWSGGSFNFSAINNTGEKYAKGEYLLFLNNDTEMINPDSIDEMVGMCQRKEVGAVGAKLLYEDDTVQHAGVVIGFGGTAGHVFHGIHNDDTGYMMRALINTNYSAVTGACMMMPKDLFEKVGGFDEELAVAFNDIDLCLKVREENKLVVYNAFSLWHHYESISRGYDDESPEKKARFKKESDIFRRKWKKILTEGDPFYNANFDVGYTPFELH